MNENREQFERNGGDAGGGRLSPAHFTSTMIESKKQAKRNSSVQEAFGIMTSMSTNRSSPKGNYCIKIQYIRTLTSGRG